MSDEAVGTTEEFSDDGFWEKVRRSASASGCPLLCMAFKLYYALDNPAAPPWAKAIIWGALAYLVSPIDAIPDATPVVGYADDLGVLTFALARIATYVDDDVVRRANDQVKRLVGACDC